MKKTIIILIGILIIGSLIVWYVTRVHEIINIELEESIEQILIPRTETLFVIPEEHALYFSLYLTFSPDNQRFAYVTRENGKEFIVLDGTEQEKKYRWTKNLNFSPDSQYFVYVARENEKEFIVLDGIEEQKKYDWVSGITFSPDSQHFAYAARENGKEFIILDGIEEQKKYDRVKNLNFSPNSQHFAYAVRENEKEFIVLDGIEKQKKYDWVKSLNFSPDSQRFSYAARENGKEFIILDGIEEQKKYDWVSEAIFSSDSQRFAYIATYNAEAFIILDGIEQQKRHDWIYGVTFSPDSQRFSYAARENEKSFIVLDGTEQQKRYDWVSEAIFSPDSQRFVYIAIYNDEEFVVLDGIEKNKYDTKLKTPGKGFWEYHLSSLVFSSDSKNFAYIYQWVGKYGPQKGFVILNDIRQEIYYLVSNLSFAPDSNYIIYNALDNRNILIITEKVSFLPETVNLKVPFVFQAPLGDWSHPFSHTCEEAVILMMHYYIKNKVDISPIENREKLLSLVEYQESRYKDYKSNNARETAQLIEDYYENYLAKIEYDVSIEDIKQRLAKGSPVIVPVNGQFLENPYFISPGPPLHMLLIKGYNNEGFIVHDPGTKKGADYFYSFEIFEKAFSDYNSNQTAIVTVSLREKVGANSSN